MMRRSMMFVLVLALALAGSAAAARDSGSESSGIGEGAFLAAWTASALGGETGPFRNFPGSLRWGREEPEPQGAYGIEEKPEGRRSLGRAVLYSALLPGLGERYLGAPRRGWAFMGAEAAVWGTWGTFMTQEWLRRQNYIEMAEVFAGVSGDHDDEYWKVVGQFANWLDYNEWLRYQARREYGFGTGEYYDYIASHEIDEQAGWDWSNTDRRTDYAAKRKASLNAERRATYTLYALLVNRVISLVDTWRIYRSREEIRERIEDQHGSLGLDARPDERGVHWRLGWYRSF